MLGIDVSTWNGRIDWNAVKRSGVKFALLRLGYGSERSADGCHSEDPFDYLGSFRINIQCLLIIRFKHIAIRNGPTAPETLFHSVSEYGLYLLTGVLRVPLVHDVQERSEFIVHRVIAVDVIIDRYEPDTFIREKNLRIIADLKIVPSEAAHILHADDSHITGLDFFQKGSKARSVEVST